MSGTAILGVCTPKTSRLASMLVVHIKMIKNKKCMIENILDWIKSCYSVSNLLQVKRNVAKWMSCVDLKSALQRNWIISVKIMKNNDFTFYFEFGDLVGVFPKNKSLRTQCCVCAARDVRLVLYFGFISGARKNVL